MTTVRIVALWACCVGAAQAQDPERGCEPSGGLEFVCGPQNAEDLVQVPGTDWIIASGMDEGAGFALIDAGDGTWSALEFGQDHDAAAFPDCPMPPSEATFNTHGLNLRAGEGGSSTLYVVGHGAREAIEVFDVNAAGEQPELTWQGCVVMPEGLAANSVASFSDGSLLATVLIMPGKTFADSIAGRPTGAVYEWSPGQQGFELVRGSELPANNGIEVSADGTEFYVASSGFQTVVAFSHSNPTRQLRTTQPLPITPDNVHMSADGRLLTAGMKNDEPACGGKPGPEHDLEKLSTCPRGTIALAIDPAAMDHEILIETPADPRFSNATMALVIEDEVWIGTFSGDRVAHAEVR